MPESSPPDSQADRASRVHQLVEECLSRRASGESVSDEQILHSHPELMPELERELRKLALVQRARAQAEATDRLGAGGSSDLQDHFELELPDWLPGYEVTREIHRGGQGIVYQAIQKSTQRKVAIKVMREGPFAGTRDRARFEREIQILGQLDDPGVVRIHDSGTAGGCFYFVMDYIPGQALDAHMAGDQRSIDATLRLFRKICEAVNAAHLRGVIHRDLKPGNIRIDSSGQPHILDFGLAKLATRALTDEARPQVMSMTGQFIGSLPWASPEQAEGSPDKIDTRTDVYALGVVLYQMLTGRFPYAVTGGAHEVLENILRSEPVRPGTLRREINDEVETIVLKCLRKERERRYQTAGELARDVQHYLNGEPIDAKRDSGWYMLRKTVGRYRVPVAVSAAFIVLILAFATSMTFMYQRADSQARKAELYAGFLDNMLASVNPDVAAGRDVTLLRDLLDDAAERVDELADQPEVEAAVRRTIGRTYLKLGQWSDAAAQLNEELRIRRRLFGDEHLDLATTLNDLGWALKEDNDYAAAEPLYREALTIRKKLLGEEHGLVAEVLNNLAQLLFGRGRFDEAEALHRRALEMRITALGEEHEDVATSLANLGSLLRDRGKHDEAEPLLRRALAIRRDVLGAHPHTAVSLNKLGLLRLQSGDAVEAEQLLRAALDMRLSLLEPDHPHIGVAQHNLALALRDLGRDEEAEPLFREALDLLRAQHGDDHRFVAGARNSLAGVLHRQGHYAEAEEQCRQGLAVREALLGKEHHKTAESLLLLGQILLDTGRPEEAERTLRDSFKILKGKLEPGHSRTACVASMLGACLTALERFDEAEPLLLGSYEALVELRGAGDGQARVALGRIIELYEAWEQPERAAEFRTKSPAPNDAD